MSKKGGGGAVLQKDAPWRASPSGKPIPKIHHSPVLRLPKTPYSDYALSIMKHPNPIGSGLGNEAIVEAAGPDCIVPGQTPPIKLLGLKLPVTVSGQVLDEYLSLDWVGQDGKPGWQLVWPINIDLKFLEPVGRELKSIGKFMDSAVDLMNKSFIDR